MKKNYFKYFLLFFVIIFFILVLIFILNKNEKIVKIAVCPSFYNSLKNGLDKDYYSVILTNSTSESLALLSQKKVDYALGGRILRPEEPRFNYRIIGDGFSFLAFKELTIYDYNLSLYPIFTDLDTNLVKENFGSLDISLVDDVYEYLEAGVIITSWDNTDYSRASIVHLLKVDDSRNLKSRLPIVYCYNNCQKNVVSEIKNIIN